MYSQLAEPEVSRHKCLIYDGHPSEQLPVVIPLLRDGLRENWRCLYLGSPDMVRMVDDALLANDVDTIRETHRGALVLSSDRNHLSDNKFEPRALIESLSESIDDAVRDGFEGLCATGDMRWELGVDENFDLLLEYEARLDQLFREKPLRGICQYHRKVLPQRAVQEALLTHRSTYVNGVLNRDNFYYIPPELLLETRDGSSQGEWMCQQILRVVNAEESRDKALHALQESEAHQRHLAHELAEMNHHLERRVAERTAELETINRHLEAFSYSVSHDLRGPLQSIVGFSSLLADQFAETLGEKGRKHLDRVQTSAFRMREMIEGMLTMARVAKGNLNSVSVDLTALAEEITREIRETGPARSAEFVIHQNLRALGDRVLLRAALSNLLGNAWKFTSKIPNARIEFGLAATQSDATTFFVRDNGAGFPMENAEKLFDAFERLHKQEEFPGTGVGLATVQKIIVRHGGQIWAESLPGHGATFFFTLPKMQQMP
jgi:signal transduction histidine kinase